MIKKIAMVSTLTLIVFSNTAFASANGFYGGGELGYSDIDDTAGHVIPFTSGISTDGLGGRVFGGYQFNRFIAAEGGFGFDQDSLFKATNQINVDLEAKGMLPITQCFNVFGKLGGTYVDQNQGGSGSAIRPLYGLGLGYDINRKVNTTLEWTRIIGEGSLNDSNSLLLGLAYHLG